MYPEQNLTRLAQHKAMLRNRISRRRAECAGHAGAVMQPLEFVDRLVTLARRFAPLAKLAIVPLGWLLMRRAAPRRGLLASLLRWGPLAYGLARSASKAGRR